MFSGDLIFYPLQGAGIVNAQEVHEFQGEAQKYFKVFIPLSKLEILIPHHKAAELGIRPLSTLDVLDRSRARFFDPSLPLPADPAQRRNLLQAKLTTGALTDEVELIRDLVCADKDTIRFSRHDRYMLQTACRMLISELMVAEDISYEFARQIVEEDIEIRVSGDERYYYRYV
ncbi:hypothetical protein [Paenibacillus sp. MMS20-IR301]|uniref:CarD family transcriptional regulator n=1 Tax=Paenibacillus sp. MMS20-IR301 TaxID=2895946 RepID=UPI0028E99758|nr:hypothetical protein [Paenibacillus sp. MMS20-IR301]WNS43947.1 hypothetical protein LOS79_01390 [Paenibacillus sp. MMS20-IR301]